VKHPVYIFEAIPES